MKRLSTTETLLELGKWIDTGRHVELRVNAGIPQRAIADDCHVTKGCVTRWEKKQRRPAGRAALAYYRSLRAIADAEGSV